MNTALPGLEAAAFMDSGLRRNDEGDRAIKFRVTIMRPRTDNM
ncbi:MAG: hypothetical protein QOJ91_1173 [Sphingomonadales bacterium]|jgi:hypothetical protein|nr:hypothetical protein [Sphingomonadales bacterium]